MTTIRTDNKQQMVKLSRFPLFIDPATPHIRTSIYRDPNYGSSANLITSTGIAKNRDARF